MAEQDLQSLKVTLCGRNLPLKVRPEDVETMQEIVKEINKKVKEFQMNYSHKDLQDCMSMVLLNYAVDLHQAQQQDLKKPLTHRIVELNDHLDQLIRNKYTAS